MHFSSVFLQYISQVHFSSALCSSIDSCSKNKSLFDNLLSISHNVAINKDSNVPGKSHLARRSMSLILYSTMLWSMYSKEPKNFSKSVSSPEIIKSVIKAVAGMSDIKLES